MDNRFIIGIDLGTTQCALSYVDLEDKLLRVRVAEIPQYVGEGMIEALSSLPSVIYLSDKEKAGPEGDGLIIGSYAKELGLQDSERFIHSSKSWLCHPRVERKSPILPWQSSIEHKLSPVEAAAEYLKYLASFWNKEMGQKNEAFIFERQRAIVTVPASFDPAARNLTLEAIELAGFKNVTLLEEPQAAFYDYLQRNPSTMVSGLKGIDTVLVVDVGGGTTDFSLIGIDWSEKTNEPSFNRLAVGPHLLVGGDNLDLALARYVEAQFKHKGKKLVGRQWLSLLAQGLSAKERVLSEEAEEDITFTITGSGSRVLGGTNKLKVSSATIKQLLIDGFFPLIEADEVPDTDNELGLSEAGLPFTKEPAITKHLAAFLKENKVMPDAVLFNGGTLKADCLRERLLDILSLWRGREIKELKNPHPILAVSAGAAYYGLASLGFGNRIQSGSAVSVYLGVGTAKSSTKERHVPEKLVCVLTKGSEAEVDFGLDELTLGIDLSREAAFYLFYTPSPPKAEQMGRLIRFNSKRYLPLPPLRLKASTGKGEKQVKVRVRLRETGFMQIFCEEIGGSFSQELRFDLGESEKSVDKGSLEQNKRRVPVSSKQLKAIEELISRAFEGQMELNRFFKELEVIIGFERGEWDALLLRQLFDMFAEHEERFNASYQLLGLYFRLMGYCLRPGFGVSGDVERVDRIWALLDKKYEYENTEFWADWWIMLKRVSCGFSVERQEFMKNMLEELLLSGKKPAKGTREITRHERNQMWRLMSNLERLPSQEKERLGWKIIKTPMSYGIDAISLITVARFGARILTYGADSTMVPKETADAWVEALLKKAVPGSSYLDSCLRELGRKTGDRLVQIDDILRKNIVDIFKKKQRKKAFMAPLLKVNKLEDADLVEITGEALPSGFVWVKES